MQSIDSALKDGSPIWAKVCTLRGNVFCTWIYWSSGAAKWAYASHPYDFPRDVHGWFPIAINQTMQFPSLTPESQSVLRVAGQELPSQFRDCGLIERRYSAAVIREARRQASACDLSPEATHETAWLRLGAIADNLHSPLPPTPPTKEEMETALCSLLGQITYHPKSQLAQEAEILLAGIPHYCHD